MLPRASLGRSCIIATRLRQQRPYAIAIAIVIAFFAVIEATTPYYFFQDDNRDIFVPLYLHNYRAAADGQLAQFNFYQSLGRPHFASGQVAALHPIPYISIFLSNAILGHPFATADILALIYLLLGATGAVFLIRLLGFSDSTAVFAAVAWTLTPFNLFMSTAWTTFPPVVGTLPWIVAGALLIYRRRYALGAWIFILSHLTLIFVGAPQFVLYAAYVEAGVILLLAMFERPRDALRIAGVYVLLILLIAGLSMPLLLPMWKQMQLSAFRGVEFSDWNLRACSITPAQFVNGLALPFSRFYEPASGDWCADFPASFTHQGYLATLLLLAYPWARRRIAAEQRRVLDTSLIVGLVLLVAMMGWLTHIIHVIPLVNRFRWPFKYFGFANLLFVMCAAAVFDMLPKRRIIRATLILLQVVNVLALSLSFPIRAFIRHKDPVPLEEPLRAKLGAGRIISLGWKARLDVYTLPTIGFDYGTLWELHYFGGYDPMVPSRNLNLTYRLDHIAVLNLRPDLLNFDYLRFWGVRWYVLNEPYVKAAEPILLHRGLRRVHSDQRRAVYEDPFAEPLVGSPDCVTRSIGRNGDDLVSMVDCRRAAAVRLKFLYHPYFIATVDGAPAAIERKVSSQMTVPVPPGVHTIRLAYDDPAIDAGIWIAVSTAAIAIVALMLWRERRRKRVAPPPPAAI